MGVDQPLHLVMWGPNEVNFCFKLLLTLDQLVWEWADHQNLSFKNLAIIKKEKEPPTFCMSIVLSFEIFLYDYVNLEKYMIMKPVTQAKMFQVWKYKPMRRTWHRVHCPSFKAATNSRLRNSAPASASTFQWFGKIFFTEDASKLLGDRRCLLDILVSAAKWFQ